MSVGKPAGKYAVFDAENAYKVPDVTFGGVHSSAHEFSASGRKEQYATEWYGLKAFIDSAELEDMEGPFKLWEKRSTEMLVTKLELAQEKRVAEKVLGLSGRSTTLTGTGTGKTNKWGNASDTAGGDPHAAVQDAIAQLFFRPNLMVLPESVFDAIEYHPRLLSKLGEANMIKKVDETTLAKLFRIDRVVIAQGKADFGKRDRERGLTLGGIWGATVALAYVSAGWDEPCAGKTLIVRRRGAGENGYIVRTWTDEDG